MKSALILASIALFAFPTSFSKLNINQSSYLFEGKGTKEKPYLINDENDLFNLASYVNDEGERFENVYFRQTKNIDLQNKAWTPIGIYESSNYFYGIYDGNGYTLSNLYCSGGNAGMFGMLGGICMNLGIESGNISGVCVGAFSSHAASNDAIIVNCYNKATVSGARAGGIVDNFIGTVISCWSDCLLSGDEIGGISSYSIFRANYCYSTSSPFPSGKSFGQNCKQVNNINTKEMADILNEALFSISDDRITYKDLNSWSIKDGKLSFAGKQGFNFWYFIKSNILYILVFLFIIAIYTILAVNIFKKDKTKTKQENKEEQNNGTKIK